MSLGVRLRQRTARRTHTRSAAHEGADRRRRQGSRSARERSKLASRTFHAVRGRLWCEQRRLVIRTYACARHTKDDTKCENPDRRQDKARAPSRSEQRSIKQTWFTARVARVASALFMSPIAKMFCWVGMQERKVSRTAQRVASISSAWPNSAHKRDARLALWSSTCMNSFVCAHSHRHTA